MVALRLRPGGLARERGLSAPMLLPLDSGTLGPVAVLVDAIPPGGGQEGCPRQSGGQSERTL